MLTNFAVPGSEILRGNNPPLPVSGGDAGVRRRVDPPLPVAGGDADVRRRVDPPLPVSGGDADVRRRVDPPFPGWILDSVLALNCDYSTLSASALQ